MGIAIHPERGKVYWSTQDPERIMRSNLDGSDMEDVVTENLNSIQDLVLVKFPDSPIQAAGTLPPVLRRY